MIEAGTACPNCGSGALIEHAVHDDTTRLLETIARCTKLASIKPEQIQSVFLTGGSTGIPAVRERM